MTKRPPLALPLALVALLATPSHALTILGTGVNAEELAALAGILTQSTSTAITVDQILTKTEQGLRAAQQTAELLRVATEVVVDFQYLTTNPDKIFDDAQASFGASFPELEAIARDVEASRANLAGERAGEARHLFQLMAHARQTRHGTYQTMMAYDNLADGHLSSYLSNVELLQATARAAHDVRRESELALTEQKAAVLAARAAAISATAETQAAAAALETSRVLQQQYVNERAAEAGEELARSKNAADLVGLMPADESIDGLETLRRMRDNDAPVAPMNGDETR